MIHRLEIITKISETNNWFLENVNKLNILLAKLREKEDSVKIMYERQDK
jgi:hypothetical protein